MPLMRHPSDWLSVCYLAGLLFSGCSPAGPVLQPSPEVSPPTVYDQLDEEVAPNAGIESVFLEYGDRKKADRSVEWEAGIRTRCFQIANQQPGTEAELKALLFVADRWPKTEDGQRAYTRLLANAKSVASAMWAGAFNGHQVTCHDLSYWQPLAGGLIERIKADPSQPDGGYLLAKMSGIVTPDPDEDVEVVGVEFQQIGDLIVQHFATSPDLANFCERVGGTYSDVPVWCRPFEPHLRKILAVNQDRFVRCVAKLALSNIVRSGGLKRQSEALQLYEEFLTEFDGKTEYHASSIEANYRFTAQRMVDSIRELGLGKAAPLTVGTDLDGKPLSIESYRGQVVLLAFWATWCGPCLKAMPHEIELLKRFGDQGFVIVGANSDVDISAARKCAIEKGVTWPSFQIKNAAGTHVAEQWHVGGYPSFFLLDREGVVQGNWQGLPPGDELDEAVRQLVVSPDPK